MHVSEVIKLEPEPLALVIRHLLPFCLVRLNVDLGTRAKVKFGIGKEVARTSANNVGAADFGIRDGELRRARMRISVGGAHELLEQLALFCGHDV